MTDKTHASFTLVETAYRDPVESSLIDSTTFEEVTALAEQKAAKPPKKNNPHYLSNAELYNEVVACLETGILSDKLARMFQLLCRKFATKGNLHGYSYIEDSQSIAMINLLVKWKKFNPEKSTNAFSYFTECIKNSIKFYLKVEKREQKNRDALMSSMGLTPSLSYQLDNSNPQQGSDDY